MATDRPSDDEAVTCDATLVLHADGSSACPHVDVCGAQPDRHSWWITCAELTAPCGCTGDEHPGAGRLGTGTGLLGRAA